MKPLPAQTTDIATATDNAMPSLPSALGSMAASYSVSNRRTSPCSAQRAYPWLLCASTAVAAAFCLMYMTKPFIQASQTSLPVSSGSLVSAKSVSHSTATGLMPDKNSLPGEKSSVAAGRTASPAPAAFEQTNLRIQHLLTAESPGGHLAKIDLDVPVLYQSRNLRWTPAEVAEARALLVRLADYQEKSRALRLEGAELLDSWNRMIEQSIPSKDLRADSPTLPINQQDAASSPRPAGLNTTELIQIQPTGK